MSPIEVWAKKLQKLLNSMPKGYEGIVSYNEIQVHKAGTMQKHMGSEDDGFWMKIDPVVCIDTKYRIIPYSEGT